ncbi:hypothetical protein SlGVgp065 [Spodoptera litura granulovirus]|uniref:P47 n=1 Tax=Spodoptera litura granulovirus TaxID=359919 RepID=A5IZR7_9BBAC|nr:hypothetical protein SlGVgp065 [Spodoptera litura granulovirus]ABQ52008.1 hypothetical protein SlGVgp065 [Spodoptera litura granulovirus]
MVYSYLCVAMYFEKYTINVPVRIEMLINDNSDNLLLSELMMFERLLEEKMTAKNMFDWLDEHATYMRRWNIIKKVVKIYFKSRRVNLMLDFDMKLEYLLLDIYIDDVNDENSSLTLGEQKCAEIIKLVKKSLYKNENEVYHIKVMTSLFDADWEDSPHNVWFYKLCLIKYYDMKLLQHERGQWRPDSNYLYIMNKYKDNLPQLVGELLRIDYNDLDVMLTFVWRLFSNLFRSVKHDTNLGVPSGMWFNLKKSISKDNTKYFSLDRMMLNAESQNQIVSFYLLLTNKHLYYESMYLKHYEKLMAAVELENFMTDANMLIDSYDD